MLFNCFLRFFDQKLMQNKFFSRDRKIYFYIKFGLHKKRSLSCERFSLVSYEAYASASSVASINT